MPVLRYRLRSRAAPGMARIDAAQFRMYRLLAEAGVFTLTGNPATFSAGEAILDAEAGAFVLTDTAAELLWHRHLAAEAGSFALTGIDTGLSRGLSLLAEAGVFELTGVNAALTRPTWQLAAEAGTFALSGQDAVLLKAGRLAAGAGSYALSGQDIAFALGRAMIGEAGSYALTGNAVDLRKAHRLAAEVGAFILTGNAAGLARTRQMAAGAGSYTLTGIAAALYEISFSSVLTGLGLTSGLKLVLDAGDAASYTSGQSWLDRSGGGYDFFRGADGSATSTDPTFNGSAGGLSSSEYFSFDGGDYFTYDSANETWMNNLHKSGAKFTIMMWVNLAAIGGSRAFFATSRANTADVGIIIRMAGGDGRPVLQVFSGGGTVHTSVPTGALTTSTWQLLGMSLDSSDGTNGSKFFIDGTTEAFSGSYSSPSAAAATYTTKIGVDGAGSGGWLASGSRVAGVMAWEGVALTAAQMAAVFEATRDRFGV